jgi:C-terminal processing protease CtpA/Prc
MSFLSETEAANDAFAIIEYVHKEIDEYRITSVVLDLTCNGGGAVTAAAYVTSWILGGELHLYFNA